MADDILSRAREDIENSTYLADRLAKLAGVVTTLFGENGHELVVVGETALALYTEGRCGSNVVDMSRTGDQPIPLRLRQRLMAGMLDAVGGPRTYEGFGVRVHLVGRLENDAQSTLYTMQTAYGTISLIPPEQLLVERLVLATFPVPDEEAERSARELLSAALSDRVQVDWEETRRLAADERYNVRGPLARIRSEVESELRG